MMASKQEYAFFSILLCTPDIVYCIELKVSTQNIADEINQETATEVQIVNFRLEQSKYEDMKSTMQLGTCLN